MEDLIISVDLEIWSALVWAKSDLQMHSTVRKPNYPKVEKKGKNNPATVVLAQPPQIKMWSTEWHVWARQRSLVPELHRTEHSRVITLKYFLISLKAPSMSRVEEWGELPVLNVCSILLFVHQTLPQAEHTLHFPFLLQTLCCHGSNSVGSAFPWHSLTESCL